MTESQAEQLRDSCLIVLRHLASLRFEDTPDFSLLHSAVKSVLADPVRIVYLCSNTNFHFSHFHYFYL